MRKDKTLITLLEKLEDIIVSKNLIGDTYIVGGTVRGLLLHRPIKDIDIALRAEPYEIGREFSNSIDGSFFILHEEFNTIRIIKSEYSFDISSMRGASISDDLLYRDFTVNALAIPFDYFISGILNPQSAIRNIKSSIIDVLDGLNDLKTGTIRMVSQENLIDDPLRLLRAHRLSTDLGFEIESETLKSIRKLKKLISKAAPERIMHEIKYMLINDRSYKNILSMSENGLLFEIFPELNNLRGLNYENLQIDIFKHTMLVYNEVEKIIRRPETYLPYINIFIDYLYLSQYVKVHLKLSILLHETGKPEVKETLSNGRSAFYGYERASAEIAKRIYKRLKTSKKEINLIDNLITNHSAILSFIEKPYTTKTLIGFLKEVKDNIYGLIITGVAHINVMHGIKTIKYQKDYKLAIKKIIEFFTKEFVPKMNAPRLLTGIDLREKFRLKPSPLYKTILSMIDEKVLEGTVKSKYEALSEVKKFLNHTQLRR